MKFSFVLISTFFLIIGSSFGQTETISSKDIKQIPSFSCVSDRVPTVSSVDIDVIKEETEESLLDITDPELSGLMAQPNPTKGMISVIVPSNMIGLNIQVHDMMGRVVGNPMLIESTTQELTIEGENGVYLITIVTEKEILTERILLDKN